VISVLALFEVLLGFVPFDGEFEVLVVLLVVVVVVVVVL
jgi:hypothetical protein